MTASEMMADADSVKSAPPQAAAADAARTGDRAEQQRGRQQDHHQPVRLELDRARRRQRVDLDRDEPHDRDERDQRERAGGRLDGVDRASTTRWTGRWWRGAGDPRRSRREQQPRRAGAREDSAADGDRGAAHGQRRDQREHAEHRQRERECPPARFARGRRSQVAGRGAHGRGLTGVVGVRRDPRVAGGRAPAARRSRRWWCPCAVRGRGRVFALSPVLAPSSTCAPNVIVGTSSTGSSGSRIGSASSPAAGGTRRAPRLPLRRG